MACPWRGRHHLGFAKPACSIWIQLALYHRDINTPNSPKGGGNATVGCIACNHHYFSGAAPQKSPCMVLTRSFLLLLMDFSPPQPIRQKRSHGRASGCFSSGMNQLFLSPSPQGWCARPRFGRCPEAVHGQGQSAGSSILGPPWGRHQDRDAGRNSCPNAHGELWCTWPIQGPQPPALQTKLKIRNLFP